ncbi:MAG: nuclear transport factor 2 family protein [Rhizomicrobium sp.]
MAENIAQTVADLDTRYQAAVKINDADTMASILHEDMVLVRGNGDVVTRAQILDGARGRDSTFEIQDEEPGSQKVRVWGDDTAVVTAKLRIKGTRKNGEIFDRTVWFSDTYVRTPAGWRYAFAQVAPLP